MMPSANDVVALIVHARGGRRPWRMQLQKLLYYSQAWSLVWDGEPLFPDPIEAWKGGPVVRSVWCDDEHFAGGAQGDRHRLSARQAATVTEVVRVYGNRDGGWLSELTHREEPWNRGRAGVPAGASSRNPIQHEWMRDYYGKARQPQHQISDEYVRGLRVLVALPEDEAERLFSRDNTADVADVIAWLEGTGADPWARSSA